MPRLKTYDLFISHAWRDDDDYNRLVNLLLAASLFKWRNYSVPQHHPLDASSAPFLRQALDRRIRPVNAVLIISGMYVNYRDWIQYEMKLAQHYNKPIIGIRPWGAERIPVAVQQSAAAMVGWNTRSIVRAVRNYAI